MYQNTSLTVGGPGLLTGATDFDGDPINALLTNAVAGATVQVSTNGAYVFTPDTGFSGTNCFTFVATDGMETSLPATVCVVVLSNSPPAVQDQDGVMFENTTLDVPAPGVLADAADPDGDLLTASLISATGGFTVNIESNGAFAYTPQTGFVGTNCFTFAASDGKGGSATGTVCITVEGPTANADNFEATQEEPLFIDPADLLANDTNSLANPLVTAILVSQPSAGFVNVNSDGTFVYAPDAIFANVDHFQYKATDGIATSAPATVSINVNPVDGVGDIAMNVISVRFRQFRDRRNSDWFSVTGRANPRGADTILSNAMLSIDLAGFSLGVPVPLDAKGRGISISPSNVQARASFNPATGAFSVRVKNLDLSFLGIPNITTYKVVIVMPVRLQIAGANLDIAGFNGVPGVPYATLADRYTYGRVKTPPIPTLSGVFNALRTEANQVGTNFTVSCAGTIAQKGGGFIPTVNDVLLTIGQHVITISSNLVSTNAEISVKSGQVPELARFALSSRRQSFQFQTMSILDTGIPLATNGAPTIFELPLRLEFSTNTISTNITSTITNSITNVVTNVVITPVPATYRTTIELKRPDPLSTKWSR